MKILILGLGHVGKALAQRWMAAGHEVVGTTTTPSKVADLEKLVTRVEVLKGEEADKVKAAAEGCDVVIATVAPAFQTARTPEEREATYRAALVDTCTNAAAACPNVIFLSSFSVYGDGGAGSEPISEQTPTANHDEPSSKYYQLAEQAALQSGGTVLRLPDIYGAPGDYSFEDRVKLAHKFMGGKVPFGPNAPLYRIHYLDVVEATDHALQKGLKGVYNVCDNDDLPETNKVIFDALADKAGVERLEFLDQIKAPNRKISASKLYDTGYCVTHSKQAIV